MSPNGLHIQLLNCWFSHLLNLTVLIIRTIAVFVGLCLYYTDYRSICRSVPNRDCKPVNSESLSQSILTVFDYFNQSTLLLSRSRFKQNLIA